MLSKEECEIALENAVDTGIIKKKSILKFLMMFMIIGMKLIA